MKFQEFNNRINRNCESVVSNSPAVGSAFWPGIWVPKVASLALRNVAFLIRSFITPSAWA